MPTRVKICGVTRLEDAQLAAELGASALGFNFYPPSPRYIAPAVARDIIRRLPPFITAVGVFADETDAAHINEVADEAGVAMVQLHGPKFPADDCVGRYPVIRAIRMPKRWNPAAHDLLPAGLPKEAVEGIESMMKFTPPSEIARSRNFCTRAFLLDTADPVLLGGTGRTFDWKMAGWIQQFGPIILAGGLTPENVARAIREARPFAVDVATGVESSPGVKDPVKLKAFFSEVERANRECV